MDKPHFTIRPATLRDLPAIHRIRTAAFAPIYASFRGLLDPPAAAHVFAHAEDDQGAYLEKIIEPHPDRGFLLGEMNGSIAGFCAYGLDRRKGVGTIDLNAVDPKHASRGLGTALYNEALAIMKREGMKAAQVSTGGDESHAPARAAYEKVGLTQAVPSVLLCKAL